MRRLVMVGLVGSLVLLVAAAPVAAGSRVAVHMEVETIFDPDPENPIPDEFTATGIAGCESGLVSDGGGKLLFTPAPGLFLGYKVFDCGDDTGFVVRLNAQFGPGGSVGSWTIVDSWGSVAGLSGSGKLVGVPLPSGEPGILDIYDGAVVS